MSHSDSTDLRRRAEQLAADRAPSELPPPEDLAKVLHELRVQQIELEMRNEALRAKQAELEQSRDHYADLYDFAPVGYLTLDGRGVIIEANVTAARMLGMPRERLLGRPLEPFVPSASECAYRDILSRCQRAGEGQETAGEIRLRDKGGTESVVALRCSTRREAASGELRLRMAVTEIPGRGRAEESLDREREMLQRIIDNIPVILVMWDPNLERFTLNRHAEEVLGWTTDEANAGDFLAGVYPDPQYREQVCGYMQSLEGGWREFDLTARDGTIVTSDWANVRLSDDTSIGIGVDLRERKRAEQALRRSERIFRRMADANLMGVGFGDTRGNVTYANDEMLRMMGHTREDFDAGRINWTEVLAPEYRDQMQQFSEQLMQEGKQVGYEREFLRPDGGRTPYLGAAALVDPGEDFHVSIALDLTKMRAAEKAQRRTERRLHLAQKAAGVGTFEWDIPRNRYVASPELEALYGVPTGGLNGNYEAWRERVHPEDRDEVERVVRDSLEDGELNAEWRIVWPDGSIHWVSARAEVFTDRAGNPTRMLGVNVDVTEAKLAEEKLAEARARLEAALSAGDVATWVWEISEDRVFADKNLLTFFNVSEDDANGGPFAAYARSIHPDDRDSVIQLVGEAVESGALQYRAEYRVTGADGLMRWVLARGDIQCDADGNPLRMLGVILDVTDRKQAEEALQQNLARSTALFNQMTEGLVLFDPEGNLLEMNPAALAIHGFDSVEGLRGHVDQLPEIWELFDLQGEPLPTDEWPIGRVLRGETFFRYEVRVRRRDTGKSWIGSYGGTPVHDQQGRLLLAIVTLRDVTAEVEAEQALVAARAEAEAANRAKSQFLANMSHELRTPMNAILGMTELALRSKLPSEVRDQLETARDSGAVLLDLLNELLDLSRIEAGGVELEQCPFRLRNTVAQVTSTLGVQAAEKGLEIREQIAPNVPDELVGDPLRLRQVLINLVGNAIKFTSRGAVTITADLQSRDGNEVVLLFAVQDTGEGISPNEQQRIFSPFTQADASTTRRHGGSGLGLAIVRSLVEMMGGQVRVKSKPEAGSTFSFDIRLRRATEPIEEGANLSSAAAAAGSLDMPRRRLRILLVEDARANRKLMGYLLANRGHQYDVAVNGRQALQRVRGAEYDVVLMDVQMPEMDGLQAAREIRKLPDAKKAGIPIIAMTAHALEGDAERCLAAGMNDYVSKPIDAEHLIALLENIGEPRDMTLTEPQDESPGEPEDDHPDVFDRAEAVRKCFGREEMLHGMIDGFFEEVDPLLAKIRSAIEHNDTEGLQQASHRLKNAVIYLGAPRAEQAAERVHELAHSGKLAEAPAAFGHVAVEIEKLKAAIKSERDRDRS